MASRRRVRVRGYSTHRSGYFVTVHPYVRRVGRRHRMHGKRIKIL